MSTTRPHTQKRRDTKRGGKRPKPERSRLIKGHKNAHRASRRPFHLPTAALTVGGLGFFRPAPGTWGSLPPAGLALLLLALGASPLWMTVWMGVLLLAASTVCVYWGEYALKRFGRKDAAEVVADETAGGALPFLFLPAAVIGDATVVGAVGGDTIDHFVNAIVLAVVGFGLFRLFDIWKPAPARRLEALPHGWGVLADDLAAGAFALAAMQLFVRFLW